jgi:hypothetical protein
MYKEKSKNNRYHNECESTYPVFVIFEKKLHGPQKTR